MDGQKAQLDIKKHGGGLMTLVIVSMRNGNYERIGNRKTSKNYQETKKKAKRTVYQATCEAERTVKTNRDIISEQVARCNGSQ